MSRALVWRPSHSEGFARLLTYSPAVGGAFFLRLASRNSQLRVIKRATEVRPRGPQQLPSSDLSEGDKKASLQTDRKKRAWSDWLRARAGTSMRTLFPGVRWPRGGRFRNQIDPCLPPPFAASHALGLAQIADGAAERFGQLEVPPLAHGALAFFQCLDRVTGDAKPLGELTLRQAGALAQMAQSFRLQ